MEGTTTGAVPSHASASSFQRRTLPSPSRSNSGDANITLSLAGTRSPLTVLGPIARSYCVSSQLRQAAVRIVGERADEQKRRPAGFVVCKEILERLPVGCIRIGEVDVEHYGERLGPRQAFEKGRDLGSRRHQRRAPALPGGVVNVDEDEGRRRRHAVGRLLEEPDHLIGGVVPYPPNHQQRRLEAEDHDLDQDAEHNGERELESLRMVAPYTTPTPLPARPLSRTLRCASAESSYDVGIAGATGPMSGVLGGPRPSSIRRGTPQRLFVGTKGGHRGFVGGENYR